MAKKESNNAKIIREHKLTLAPPSPEEASRHQQLVEEKQRLEGVETHTPESLVREYTVLRFGQGVLEDDRQRLINAANKGTGGELVVEVVRFLSSALGKQGLKDALADHQFKLDVIEMMLAESQDRGDHGWGLYGSPETTVKMPSGAALRVQKVPVAEITDEVKLFDWCYDEEKGNLRASLKIHASRLQSITKERLALGLPAPDGVVIKHFYNQIFFKKPGATGGEEE